MKEREQAEQFDYKTKDKFLIQYIAIPDGYNDSNVATIVFFPFSFFSFFFSFFFLLSEKTHLFNLIFFFLVGRI